MKDKISRYFPILQWGRTYKSETFVNDAIAAIIVTIMLIPQSLAYALLAGLPPQIGLYASILPLIIYAIFGTSRSLAVGPVAIISLMTAAAAGKFAAQGSAEYLTIAILLALLSGLMLCLMGILKFGFIANFLSHPVISGFITASGILIAVSQIKHIIGVDISGQTLPDIGQALIIALPQTHRPTLMIGVFSILFLFLIRRYFSRFLTTIGVSQARAAVLSRLGPILIVILSIFVTIALKLPEKGVNIIGSIPAGIPPLTLPTFDIALWFTLLGSSFMIALIGFVESVSVAQTLAARQRQSIDPNQELIGLGASNIAAAFSGGYPVTGGFARSAVNFDAGAQTPAAGALTALGIAITTLFFTPLLYALPIATLAATIIIAVLSLINLSHIKHAWVYSKSDFIAMITTILLTLCIGIEIGVMSGVILSVGLFLLRSSRPHFAEVGRVRDTEHFRNIDRHDVITNPQLVTLRIDESLYFANTRYLEDVIYKRVMQDNAVKHLILMCPAVNDIDLSALESLEAINDRLQLAGITFHLSEVKGPVMDKLKRSNFLHTLSGTVFLTQYKAVETLFGESYDTAIDYHL